MKKLDIKRALADHNMTQVQLGEKLNVFPQSLTSVIKGNPTVKKLEDIAVAIGCDITDLFYSETEDTAEELPANDNKAEPIQEVELENPIIQTETFCPHCGKRVKVGVVFFIIMNTKHLERRGSSTSLSISLQSSLSNTSHIPILILQLIIQLLGGMIIGIGICKPLIKGAVVVHLRFLLSERFHHALLFYFRKHQVHAGSKG